MPELIVFDWNGTILPDAKLNHEILNIVLKENGAQPVSHSYYIANTVMPVWKIYLNCGLTKNYILKNIKKISETFTKHYEEKSDLLRSRKGSRNLLKFLHKRSINCVILSNHPKQYILRHLLRFDMDKYFDSILANSGIQADPNAMSKTERLNNYIKGHNYNPKKIVLIGDGLEEIDIAKQLGAKSIIITGGSYDTSRLKAAKPNHIITNLNQVINIVNNNI